MVSIVIQSGGQSSRMGREKGLVPFCGKPLIQNVIERVQGLGDEVLIITNKPELYKFLKLPLYTDLVMDYGPLAGLQSGLTYAAHDIVLNLACDIPYVNTDLLSDMIKKLIENPEYGVVIPKTEKGYEPMQAVYRKSACLLPVQDAIKLGKRRMISWFDTVKVIKIGEDILRHYDQALKNFSNINTKDELDKAAAAFGCQT